MRYPVLMQILCLSLLSCFITNGYAFEWSSLWTTPDKQAVKLMQQGEYGEASKTFQQVPWKATAAYRAQNYQQAANQFQSLKTELGYYNQGNALAKMGHFEEALKAYDKALQLNPSNQDAVFNRKLIASLIKKNQDQQQSSNSQNKSEQNKSDKDKAKQDKSGQDKSKQDKSKQDKSKQDQSDQSKEANQKQPDNSQNKSEKKSSKSEMQEKQPSKLNSSKEQGKQQEKQQEKEQWLKLIPDDPGGLLREKFLRDSIRRQSGENQ